MKLNAHARAARILPHPTWAAICEGQRRKGLQKWRVEVDDYSAPASYWAGHGTEEGADGTVYALRVSDTGRPIRGRLAAFLFALAARVLLPVR